MKLFFKRLMNDTSGVTAPILALSLSSLIGVLAVTLEAGYWYKSRADLQMTADMAAFAGAIELASSTNQAAITAAKLDAIENGYDYGLGTIAVNSPALSGAYTSTNSVEVNISQKGNQFFSSLFGTNRITYNVRAVASLVSKHEACVLALNPSVSGAIYITGSVTVGMPNCSLAANSSDVAAINLMGASSVTADCLSTVGGINGASSHATLACGSGNSSAPAYLDPYADIDAPDVLDYPVCATPVKTSKWDYSLSEGRYCSSMTIKGTYELSAGTYIFDGINVKFIGAASELIGSGVTIFLMNGATFSGINGQTTINLVAPTSGDYKGIAIFSDPDTQPAGTTVKLNGGSSTSIEGLLYFPTQSIEFTGNTAVASPCTLIVADTIQMKGNADFQLTDCASTYGLDVPTLSGVYVVE